MHQDSEPADLKILCAVKADEKPDDNPEYVLKVSDHGLWEVL